MCISLKLFPSSHLNCIIIGLSVILKAQIALTCMKGPLQIKMKI